MVYQVPDAKSSVKQNVFEFKIPGSKKVWALPKLQYLNADFAQRLSSTTVKVVDPETGKPRKRAAQSDILAIEELQREIIEHYCPGLYLLVDRAQLEDIAGAWRDASSVSVGESSASSDS